MSERKKKERKEKSRKDHGALNGGKGREGRIGVRGKGRGEEKDCGMEAENSGKPEKS